MANSIDRLLDELIQREGGFVNHPDDRGGPTKFGITRQTASANGYNGAMRDFPRALALEIYTQRYWEAPRFDRVAEIAPHVAEELFDTGVNMGPAVATAFLQRALNALNRNARDWADISLSRHVDEATLAALRSFIARRGQGGERVLVRALDALQGARYIELAEGRAANESFVYGWLAHRLGNAMEATV
jgi:lysozyme family protein|tara:strand:+ start:21941 stop:22507 length:567 start_codon:yes stop_codon:yes gene_type:complete